MNIDWQKWMEEHHIKLRGEPNDNGPDEVLAGRQVSGTEVETQVHDDAGKTGNSYI